MTGTTRKIDIWLQKQVLYVRRDNGWYPFKAILPGY